MTRVTCAAVLWVAVAAAVPAVAADDHAEARRTDERAPAAATAAGAQPRAAYSPREESLGQAALEARESLFTGSAEHGWSLFREKGCIRCHAVWGEGGDIGPDLGRTSSLGHINAGQLAGVMWNHVPRMWEKMEEGGIRLTPIAPKEMSDLFALLLFIRYADEPGDPAEGKRVLAKHSCDKCHSIDEKGGTTGPDLGKWARFVNPVVWAQKMWTHAPKMKDTMAAMGVVWPRFEASDLVNIVAYIRSSAVGDSKEYLEPGSIERGQRLFEERGCASCHTLGETGGIGPDLQTIDLPDTLSGIASQMWNHAPEMLQEGHKRGDDSKSGVTGLEAQEMADVITFVLARRYFLAEGDAKQGWKVFFTKQCVACHGIKEWGGNVGPRLDPIAGNASAILMAHAMWRYGPEMLTQMAERGIPWPRFEGSEMNDLMAFLNEETR